MPIITGKYAKKKVLVSLSYSLNLTKKLASETVFSPIFQDF